VKEYSEKFEKRDEELKEIHKAKLLKVPTVNDSTVLISLNSFFCFCKYYLLNQI
jgi:hypothetical protein